MSETTLEGIALIPLPASPQTHDEYPSRSRQASTYFLEFLLPRMMENLHIQKTYTSQRAVRPPDRDLYTLSNGLFEDVFIYATFFSALSLTYHLSQYLSQ